MLINDESPSIQADSDGGEQPGGARECNNGRDACDIEDSPNVPSARREPRVVAPKPPTDEQSQPLRSWWMFLIGGGSVASTKGLELTGIVPARALPGALAIVVFGAGVGYLGRFVVHMRQGYVSSSPMRSSPALKRLVALDGVVTIVWLTSGIYIFLIPDAPSQLVISALLWVASVLVATATVLVVDDLPAQRRGCDIVNSCPCVRKLRRLLAPARRVGVLRFIDSRWDDKTEAGEISAWALSMTTVLLIVAAANVLPTLRAAIDDRGRTGHERTVARWRVRSILPTAPDFGAWTPAQVDEDVNHLVKAGFEVWQWGGTLLNLQGGALHFNVPEIIDDVTPSGAGLLVTFGAGRAALYSRRTGRPISRELQISSQPAQAVCRWRSAFFTVPRGVSENEGGYLLRARSSDLAVQAKIAIDGLLGGMVDTADTLIVGDLKRGTLVDIDIDRNYSRGPAADVPEPRTMLMAGSAVLVLEGERGCVRQISADGQRERRNAAVPAPLVAAALASDSLMVLADGGRIMQRLSVSTLRPLGPPLTLPDGVRGTDLLAVRGGWEVLSGPADLQLTVSTYDEQRMETTGPGADEIRELAPCR